MNRITVAHVEAKVNTVNSLLGFNPDEVKWSTVGAVGLYRAYGMTAVHQTCNESGGERTLHNLGTLREAAIFLNGMIETLRLDNLPSN